MVSKIIPQVKDTIDIIIIPAARIAEGKWSIFLVNMNSITGTDPMIEPITKNIRLIMEKKSNGRQALKIENIFNKTINPSEKVFNFEYEPKGLSLQGISTSAITKS